MIPSTASGPIERIVLGVDGSAHSIAAVDWCADLAMATKATVVAMTVWEPYPEWTPASSRDNWRRDIERQLAKWVAPISEAGLTVEYVVQRDLHPGDGLLGVASARSGDVLVVGTRGAGGFSGLRVGGVAMKVLHRASLPVVLVPQASRADASRCHMAPAGRIPRGIGGLGRHPGRWLAGQAPAFDLQLVSID